MARTIITAILLIILVNNSDAQNPAEYTLEQQTETITATDGSVIFTVLSVSNGATYSPRNVFAIWIKDAEGNFVISRKVMAASRKVHLVKWMASSGNNSVGAITGATLPNHQFHTISWDCRDQAGELVPDGVYEIWVEYTSRNSANGGDLGPFTHVSFEKATTALSLDFPDETYFKDMNLQYSPSNVGIEESLSDKMKWKAYPNPATEGIHFSFDAPNSGFLNVTIYDLEGKRISELIDERIEQQSYTFYWNSQETSHGKVAPGVYLVRVVFDNKMFEQKVLLVR
jgi:flagellar hook assembly protein FlgD